MISYILILFITIVAILIFHYNNSYRKIERYYFNNDKSLFLLLELCIFILAISFIYHIRFLIIDYVLTPWMKRLTNKKL